MHTTPSERLIDRAVELWKRALRDPVYDNGDSSHVGFMCQSLTQQLPQNSDDETLTAFGVALKEALTPDERGSYVCRLDVDYNPDRTLAAAAEKAGLKTQFPWKTRMWIDSDAVSFSIGYGATSRWHYPLENGRWLVTTLRGQEIPQLINMAEGEHGAFAIEESDGALTYRFAKLVNEAEGEPNSPDIAAGALADIAVERRRQVEVEGWTAEHDDEHHTGDLARSAATYAYLGGLSDTEADEMVQRFMLETGTGLLDQLWPAWDGSWLKPQGQRRNLVKAAALIVAEIDRLDRAQARRTAR